MNCYAGIFGLYGLEGVTAGIWLADAEAEAETKPTYPTSDTNMDAEYVNEIRVLIADGDEGSLREFGPFLREQGLDARAVTSAVECVDRLRDFEPDVLVLDPELRWGGGDGVLECMQSEPDIPVTPVIMISTRPWSSGVSWLGFVEVAEYLHKPVTPAALLEAIVRVTQHRRVKT